MICPICNNKETRLVQEVTNEGVIENTVCSEDDCGYIHNRYQIVERASGDEIKRPRPVLPEEQPTVKSERSEEGLMTAQEMMELAIRTREETVGKEAHIIVKDILNNCAKNVLEGQYEHLIQEANAPSDEVFSLIVKELRSRGYTVKKRPEPGAGTWIRVKWPTSRKQRKSKKKTQPQKQIEEDTTLTFKEKKARPDRKRQPKPSKPQS